MDFVNWCNFILNICIKAGRATPLEEHSLRKLLFAELGITQVNKHPGFHYSTYEIGMFNAMKELTTVGLMDPYGQSSYLLKVSKAGREYVAEKTPWWWSICQEKLETEHEKLLCIVNRLSQHEATDHAWLELIDSQSIVSALGVQRFSEVWSIAHELEQWGFISGIFSAADTASLQCTFKGLVWETRRGFTLESKFIDNLIANWETTSVEFKSDLNTDNAGQVAEFIKDVLSLATTKASGQGWMIIGFDDYTHEYCGSPSPKLTQNHFEQLLQEYTKPMVNVRYQVVDYRKGPVGKLEVFRDARHLPYKVAKSLGSQNDKRRITEGNIYVRHGSQVQPPTLESVMNFRGNGPLSGQNDAA